MNNKFIFLDINISSRNALFEFISKKSVDLGIVDKENSQKLVEALLRREQETSTGFENGFAIPHARIAEIKKTSVLYVRLKNGIDWKSLDNKPTKYVIFLLVTEKNASNQHMELLSNIAVGLLNKDFTSIIESSNDVDKIANSFENQMETKKTDNKKSELESTKNKLILAITACPVGIAHTYLAAEKISEAAKKLNYQVKVETHGSVGVKDEFTKDEIDKAEVIVISADVSVDTSRFVGKRIFKANIKSAIKDSNNLIKNALENGKKETDNSGGINSSIFDSGEKRSYFVKHLLSGVSYMIPFILFGGLLIALSLGLTQIIYGKDHSGKQITSPPDGTPLWYILQSGVVSFTLMIPILAGFIANSIGGRAAIAPAAVVAMISNSSNLIYMFPGLGVHTSPTPLGFLGAIFYGFIIGYSVKWINTWKIHKNISSLMPIFVIPIVVTLFYSLFSLFIINAPISYVMNKIGKLLQNIFTNNSGLSLGIKIAIWIPLGALLGAMIGFDMGGPVNKIAFVTAASLLTLDTPIKNAMGMVSASIPIAPLGMGLCTLIYKKHFTNEEKTLGISALAMGFIGISEGAIPFAISNPKKVIPTNIISSAVAGAVAGGLGVTSAVPHGGPIVGILGAVSGTFFNNNAGLQTGIGILFFFIAIASGCLTSVLFYGFLLKTKSNSNKSHKIKLEKRINHNLKLNINISRITKIYLIQYSMLALGTIFTITGISMWAVYGHEVVNIVDSWKNNIVPKIPVEIIYSNFTLLVGVLFLLLSFMHYFTFKDKLINLRSK
ncbi:MAG: fructose-specific PTS transporter subunit EIIC [Mycoplasmoidaceae bacterium]